MSDFFVYRYHFKDDDTRQNPQRRRLIESSLRSFAAVASNGDVTDGMFRNALAEIRISDDDDGGDAIYSDFKRLLARQERGMDGVRQYGNQPDNFASFYAPPAKSFAEFGGSPGESPVEAALDFINENFDSAKTAPFVELCARLNVDYPQYFGDLARRLDAIYRAKRADEATINNQIAKAMEQKKEAGNGGRTVIVNGGTYIESANGATFNSYYGPGQPRRQDPAAGAGIPEKLADMIDPRSMDGYKEYFAAHIAPHLADGSKDPMEAGGMKFLFEGGKFNKTSLYIEFYGLYNYMRSPYTLESLARFMSANIEGLPKYESVLRAMRMAVG